ncbi:MAG: S24 family peptidase, partial [Proteobacteria bacterium]|nr:S24 family peptidase [Pseudomonadota bacterium]
TLPIDERCEGKKRFCLEVRGNSMNKEFKPGSWVVCVEFDVFNDEVEDGAVYVVDHKLHGETDSTLKELRIREDGKAYLWPNSDDPAHQQPLEMKGPEDTEISIRSKVVGAYYIR